MTPNHKKPTFGIMEQIRALRLRHNWGETEANSIPHLIHTIRMDIYKTLLEKRLPYRNPDGSINWDNYFATQMLVDQPIKRGDIFPNGTGNMTDEEIIDQVIKYIEPLTVKWNFDQQATVFDPVEFPEVIDKDYREIADKINSTAFIRTGSGCAGHEYRPNGYSHSSMHITMDCNNANSDTCIKEIDAFCKTYTKENVKASVEYNKDDDLGVVAVRLKIDTPEGWKEYELPDDISPKKRLEQLSEQDGNMTDKNWEIYKRNVKDYYQSKHTYQHTGECKTIRDEFWKGIGKIADKFAA